MGFEDGEDLGSDAIGLRDEPRMGVADDLDALGGKESVPAQVVLALIPRTVEGRAVQLERDLLRLGEQV